MSFNIPEFSVSEFSRCVKRIIEDSFGYVRIKGEVTGLKRAASGHFYFTLRDESAALSAVVFRNVAQLTDSEIFHNLQDGLQVCASGKITTFEGRSNYQIIVEKLEIAGIGAILEMIEKRRQKLLAEGIFDEIHKKPIPFFPQIIAVITSKTGAVIEDIKQRIQARCGTNLLIYPVAVQGQKAAAEIITAIRFFNCLKNKKRPQILIIARGGGSFEDLMPFNDENLVREVFKSEIPVISAVGHETDTTLIDYVADLRAATPTAAAELATPLWSQLKSRLDFCKEKLQFLPREFLQQNLQNLQKLQKYIIRPQQIIIQTEEKFLTVKKKFDALIQSFLEQKSQKILALQLGEQIILQKIIVAGQKLGFNSEILHLSSGSYLKEATTRLENLSKFLMSSHYHEILKRGFAIIKNKNGNLISSIHDIKTNEEIIIEMYDGKILALSQNLGSQIPFLS
jgi:exodeoxyribonuclease VII large subunit